jgi:hypothetical protein
VQQQYQHSGQGSRSKDQFISKATEIKLHPNNMNRENGLSLIRSWNHSLKERKKVLQEQVSYFHMK